MSKYIVTADIHLRNDRPVARTDEDWIQSQKEILDFIVETANERQANIVIGGDLFNTSIVPVRIVNLFLSSIRECKYKVYIMGGNHSLLHHQEGLIDDSSVGVLQYVDGNIIYLTSQEARTDGRYEHIAEIDDEIAIVHTLCFKTEDNIPFGSNATHAQALLDKYPKYKYLFLGDNHTSFIYKDRVFNPGCPIVQNAGMIEYRPSIYFVDTVNEVYEKVYTPDHPENLTSAHIEINNARKARLEDFITAIKKDKKLTLSFEDNLKVNMVKAPIGVQDMISRIFEEAV